MDEEMTAAAAGGPDGELLVEAMHRFRYAMDVYSSSRVNMVNDVKFSEGDDINGYQWPNDIRLNRDDDDRPVLTLNKVRQHNLQILNDMRRNPPSMKVKALGSGASFEAAEAYTGLLGHIEYISNAGVAYMTAANFQVKGGLGWLRVGTDYANSTTFDQEIFIRRVKDPLSIIVDPDAQEFTKQDMEWAFVFDPVPRDRFAKKYPKYGKHARMAIKSPLGAPEWINDEHIIIAEYWYKKKKNDELCWWVDADGNQHHAHRSKVDDKELWKRMADDVSTQMRTVQSTTVYRSIIVGNEVVETQEFPGEYIPLVPVIGEETVIDGKYDVKGHTRAMRDAQRMYNYWASSAVEYGVLQTKVPWVVPAEAISGYEKYWADANTSNWPYLPYTSIGEDGQSIPPPHRIEPPVAAPVCQTGMQQSLQEMQMTSGQHAQSMGEPGTERTGAAIQGRKQVGDLATYHFTDNLALAVTQVARICLGLIPVIYDTKREIEITTADNTALPLDIDPDHPNAITSVTDAEGEESKKIFNPMIGRYAVEADTGPSFGSQRAEAYQAMLTMITQNKELSPLIGDLLFMCADFPYADEIAKRMRRMINPQALGKGPSQKEQQLQKLLMDGNKLLQTAMVKVQTLTIKLKGKEELRDVQVFEAKTKRYMAETERLKVHGQAMENHADRLVSHGQHLDKLTHDKTMRAMQMGHEDHQGDKDHERDMLSLGLQHGQDAGEAAKDRAAAGASGGSGGGSDLDKFMDYQTPQTTEDEDKDLNPVQDSNESTIAPVPGARQGKDGNWYVKNGDGSYGLVSPDVGQIGAADTATPGLHPPNGGQGNDGAGGGGPGGMVASDMGGGAPGGMAPPAPGGGSGPGGGGPGGPGGGGPGGPGG